MPGSGTFELTRAARIVVTTLDPDARRAARLLASHLRPATGFRLAVTAARPATSGDVVLSLRPGDRVLGQEGYRLTVASALVTLAARTPTGLVRGVQTLRQLLPDAIESSRSRRGPWRIPVVTVHDRPRFAWRGMMLDVARHFFDVRELERLIDLLALHKLNRLHLHLSDDQGWRLAIASRPRLARVGGRTAVGGGAGGYYTQRDYGRLVSYAAERHIDVVPEIDMPGHVNAALASYEGLSCDGRAPAPYTGIEVGFSSLCIRQEETYAFVDDVLGEVAALTPGLYLHIGGDEPLSTDPADYRFFVERVQRLVRARGKRMLGWEEVARASLRSTTVVQHWHDPELARQAVRQGAKLVLSPATRAYLDMKYTRSSELGLQWAGTTSVRKAYEWDPATLIEGVSERDIVGVEAALWSETISTRSGIDHLAFPRLLGIAEIGWSASAGRSWREYRTRLAAHGTRLLALGVGFHRAPEVPWATGSARAGDRADAGAQLGARARAPVAAACGARLVDCVQELVRVRAALVAKEVRRRGALADELHVDVLAADEDVPEQPAVRVAVVQLRIGGERDVRPFRGERDERTESGPAVAVGLELRCVDLDEPDLRAARERQRVAVVDPLDDGRRAGRRRRLALRSRVRSAPRGDERQRECADGG